MKKLILPFLLAGCSALFAQTASVSGHLFDGSTSPQTTASINFTLVNTAGNVCKVSGTAIVVQSPVTFNANGSGAISGTLYRNDFIVCGNQSNSQWQYQVNVNGQIQPTCILAQVASSTLNVDSTACSNTTPAVTPPTGDNTYCRLDGSNCGFTGNVTLGGNNATGIGSVGAVTGTYSGALTAQQFNGDLWVGSAANCFGAPAGATYYSSLAAAYAAAAAGQAVHVCAGWAETFAANLVLSKNNVGFVLHGAATITMATFQITKASGVHNAFIDGTIPIGKYTPSNAAARFIYTGTGTAFSFGDSTADTGGLSLKRLDIDITGAGSASHCIDIFRTQNHQIDDVVCSGPGGNNTAIGLLEDGTGNFTGDSTITQFRATLVQKCIQLNNGSNANTFISPACSLSATGNICLDIESGNGNTANLLDCEGAATAVNVASSANNFGNRGSVYNQGNTTDIAFGANAFANAFDFIGGVTGPVVTDSSPIGANKATWMGNNGLLNSQGAQAPLTGNAGDLNMFTTYTLKANTVLPGRALRVTCAWNHSTGAVNTTYKILIDSTVVGTAASTGVDNSQTESIITDVMNAAGSQSSQTLITNKKLRDQNVANVPISNSTMTQGTAAINFANQHTVNCSFNVANTDQVTPEQLKIELVN